MQTLRSPRGFSLVEVMVASAILACAVLSVAQVVAVSTSSTAGARGVSEATLFAWQKLDELRALAFTFDDAGAPVTDASLAPSPGGTLRYDTAGYVDHLEALGTRYRRRWSVSPSALDPDAVILRVRVLHVSREEELASAATIRVRRRP